MIFPILETQRLVLAEIVDSDVSAMLQAGFAGALPCGPLHRVQADTVPGNEASEHLLSALGFVHEGLRRECGFWKNKFHDLNCFGLLAHEFKEPIKGWSARHVVNATGNN